MRIRWWFAAVMVAAVLAGCGGEGTPKAPAPPSGNGPISVSGRERLEWDQDVIEGVDLSRYRFAAYVDSTRTELPMATCSSTGPAAAICRSPLPAMSAGTHVLTFVSYITPDNVDSVQSPPLTLIVGASLTSPTALRTDAAPATKPDAVPIDCALAPLGDHSVVVALPTGELRFVDTRGSRSMTLEWTMPDGPWTLRAVAIHPDFATNRWMYVLLTERSDPSQLALVRYRELKGVLGERAVLATFSHRAPVHRPRLRFGPDGKLYVALLADTMDSTALAASEPREFIMRLNDDGSVPLGNPGKRASLPVAATNPMAVEWDDVTGELWIVEQRVPGQSVVYAAAHRDAAIEFRTPLDSTAIGLGILRTPDTPADRRFWAFRSDGNAHELETPRRTSSRSHAFADGSVADALGTSDGDILSCGTRSPQDQDYFVQRSSLR